MYWSQRKHSTMRPDFLFAAVLYFNRARERIYCFPARVLSNAMSSLRYEQNSVVNCCFLNDFSLHPICSEFAPGMGIMELSVGSCSPLGTSQFWEPLGSASATPTLLLHYVLSLSYSLLLSSRSSFSCNNRVPRGVRCTSLVSTITATAYYHYEHFSAKSCSQIAIIEFKFYWSCRRCVSISVIFRSVSYNSIGYSSHEFTADISSSPVLNIVDSEAGVILSILFISRINIVPFNVSNLSLRSYIFIAVRTM